MLVGSDVLVSAGAGGVAAAADEEWCTRAVVAGRGTGTGDGRLAALMGLGSSRSLRKSVPAEAGCGTVSVPPVNPSGTCAGSSKAGVGAMDWMR